MADKTTKFQSMVTGMIFGFVAGAALMILSDPEKRDSAKQKVGEVASKATGETATRVNTLAENIKEGTQTIQDKFNEAISKVQNRLEEEIAKTEDKQSNESNV